jgi:putative endonuclease
LSADLGQARDRCLQRTTRLRLALRCARDTGYNFVRATLRLWEAGMNKRFFVYVLSNQRRGVLYVGATNDLIRRLSEHKAKLVPGFTKAYGVVLLVYYEEYSSILEARAREATLKRWRRACKIELVDKFNPDWRDLTDELAL